jgi:hypothetical protein
MTITNTLKPIVDRKQWEFMTPAPVTNAAGMHVIGESFQSNNQLQMYVTSASAFYFYVPKEDAWVQVPTVTLGGTFGAGACGDYNINGPSGTATAGSTTSITTNLTILADLAGYKVRFTSGTGAGQDVTITRNTTGANAIIYFDSVGVTFDNTSVYQLRTGRWYLFNPGTLSATSFQYFDYALQKWTARSVTGLPATWGTDGRLLSIKGKSFATGTATSGTNTTLVNNTKTWTVDQWIGYQIRITGGTGAGQTRVITDSDATSVTVATWTINPDSTSTYSIEGDENTMYLIGNNAVTMYKYSISGNSWSTVSPAVARAAAPGLAASFHYMSQSNSPLWNDESSIINGRRLYSFRGGAGSLLDYYDIPSNTWVSGLSYGNRQETFTTGTSCAYEGDYLYIKQNATNRVFKYDPASNTMTAFSTLLYTDGAALLGDKGFDITYTDGGTTLTYIYFIRNTGTELFRCLVI